MATDTYPDPTNAPGSESADQPLLDIPARDDPTVTGVDDDGTNEALGLDPLDPETHPTSAPDLDEPSGLVREIPDPQEDDGTSDPA